MDQYEHYLIKVLAKKYQEPVVFDVGANTGMYSKELLEIIPGAQIHLFEPIPELYAYCNALFSGGITKCNNIALSSVISTSEFYVVERQNNDLNSMSSMYYRPCFSQWACEKIEIPTTTINHYAQENKINHIHLLKIDVEGNEPYVILGASELIKTRKIDYIQFEYGGTWRETAALSDVVSYLAYHGYVTLDPRKSFHPVPVDILDDDYEFNNFVAVGVVK